MVVCPTCRSEQMNGTLFCSECGSDLQAPPSATTFDLPANGGNAPGSPDSAGLPRAANPVKSNLPPARPVPAPAYTSEPAKPVAASAPRRKPIPARDDFRLMVLNSGRVLDVPVLENIIIGRSDSSSGDQPDIDLTPDNALELGVSRRHACITFRDNQPLLTDLGSTNRTFINRQVLMRGQPYEIQDGDEVRLGNVIVKVLLNSNGLFR